MNEFDRYLTARFTFDTDHRYVVTLDTENGQVACGTATTGRGALLLAKAGAQRLYPDDDPVGTYISVRTSKPDWLEDGQPVRVDAGDGTGLELAWMGGPVSSGGMFVIGVNTGAGIYPVEDIHHAGEFTADELAIIEYAKASRRR
jgi:hypothetical protein